jgi:hypothetical protein
MKKRINELIGFLIVMSLSATKRRNLVSRLITIILLGVPLTQPVTATTYISAEPIPSEDVVGQNALDLILSAGYSNLELWSNRLLNDCHIVQNVIDVLTANGAISTINSSNARVRVAAGGFEGVTDPSFVFTVQDSGPNAASAADITVLDNALGYVLNQGGTAHFSPDNARAYDFPLDYAVVTFTGTLTGVQAKGFFEFLGTIDPALFSGQFAGFTQIDFQGSLTNNSMLFLKPATTKQLFITGLSTAASTTPGATYVTLNNNGQPTTAKAGISFPENDWIAFPGGDQYLAKLNSPSAQLLSQLATLRQRHLQAVASLVNAIQRGRLSVYLNNQFRCAE